MKNTRLGSILGSGLIALALSIGSLVVTRSASAQNSGAVEVNVPFAFHTPTQTLPAGVYRVNHISDSILEFTAGSTGGFVMIHGATRSHASSKATVVFDRYGDTYYLHQIWTAGSTAGVECSKSRAEKRSIVAANQPAPTTVELALNEVPAR
jgi:hypothetical protein